MAARDTDYVPLCRPPAPCWSRLDRSVYVALRLTCAQAHSTAIMACVHRCARFDVVAGRSRSACSRSSAQQTRWPQAVRTHEGGLPVAVRSPRASYVLVRDTLDKGRSLGQHLGAS